VDNSLIFKQRLHPSKDVLRHLKVERNVTSHHTIFKDGKGHELLDFDREHLKVLYPEVINEIYDRIDVGSVDWSKYAYIMYATSKSHMCNAMMKLAELKKFGSKADLVMLVKQEYLSQTENPAEYEMLTNFANEYGVKLKPTEVIQMGGDSVNIWLSSYTKLLVFNQTEYDRIIYMDSDAILLRDSLDELFFIPPCKMAVSTAYWLTRLKFEKEEIREKYDPNDYGFKPLTRAQRNVKIDRFINDNITPFIDPKTSYLPIHQNETTSALETEINEKNFYTNIYNSLPNYPTLNEFDLTNIVMVIQPSAELYNRVLYAMENKGQDEYDMELVQYHMFNLRRILRAQWFNSAYHSPNISFQQRLDEIPEMMLLPHQVYGTLTQQLNIERVHFSYMADTHEQVFAHHQLETHTREPAYYSIEGEPEPGDIVFNMVKYLHFSDAPIPKPWFKRRPDASYMGFRTRCPSFRDFHADDDRVKPKDTTEDCSGGRNWETAHHMFEKLRKDVCGLDLIDTKEDTYYSVIN
jgi:alpha-N-acetylglucosamine transferase